MTESRRHPVICVSISIHTSAREVTMQNNANMGKRGYFNPHFRKGSDSTGALIATIIDISIHTSAREVTEADIFGG